MDFFDVVGSNHFLHNAALLTFEPKVYPILSQTAGAHTLDDVDTIQPNIAMLMSTECWI